MEIELYEVYVCKHNDEILYVGQGKAGRHKHCNSGTSHVYELNRLHFGGVNLDVEIVYQDCDVGKVLKKEKDLIQSLKPKFNIVHNFSSKQGSQDMKEFKKSLERTDPKMFYREINHLTNAYNDMKVLYKSLELKEPFVPETPRVYDRMGLKGMRAVSYNYYGKGTFGVYFVDCFNGIFINK